MVKSAWNSARDADQIFFIVDADKIIPGGMGPGRTGRKVEALVHPVAPERLRFKKGSNEELIMKRLQERNQRYNLILNKVDQLRDDRKTLLLPLAEEIRRNAGANTEGQSMISKIFAVSASRGKGLEALRDFLRESLPQVSVRSGASHDSAQRAAAVARLHTLSAHPSFTCSGGIRWRFAFGLSNRSASALEDMCILGG